MSQPRPSRQRGASLIEFAVVFPVAALFVLALIQLGFLYMAKITLNHATFMAAREGSVHNADPSVIKEALVRGLLPFYQDTGDGNDLTRLTKARVAYTLDAATHPGLVDLKVLNPTSDTFADFGVKDPVAKVTYIPNDNLEWRDQGAGSWVGPKSKVNIRDANLLKLKVRYGYEMKVPLIAGVVRRMMCSGEIGIAAWGDVTPMQALEFGSSDCFKYYYFGRVPIESYAIVEMQTRAEQH